VPDTPLPRLLPLGDSAWTVELGQGIDNGIHARVMGLSALIEQQRHSHPLLARLTDVVPTFRSLTVHFDAAWTDAQALGAHLLALAQQGQDRVLRGRTWALPVCFDDDFAPDLARLCNAKGLTRAAVIEHLVSARLRVYLLGFQPGFAYMGGLPPALALPRLATPRARVPARSVATAGDLCGIYPWDSPGGWNLLGRTPVQLFDPSLADQPALLAAGDEVRWTAVDRATHDRLADEIAHGLPRETFLQAASS
jgi:KipI family sensor histidine kinase inhibitor